MTLASRATIPATAGTRLWRYTLDVRAVEAAGQQRGDEPPGALAQHLRIGAAVERVEIGDEDVHAPTRVDREICQRPDRAEVVAEVQIPVGWTPVNVTVRRAVAARLDRPGCVAALVMTVIS